MVGWQAKFMARCLERFDEKLCQFGDAQIQAEGGYNPHRWAEFAEGYCAWGMFQNNVCIHQGWSHDDARYIYHVLTNPAGAASGEYDRLKKFAYLLDGEWQIEKLLDLYQARIQHPQTFFRAELRHTRESAMKLFTGHTILGEEIHSDIYAALALHNFNGGRNYVARVVHKKQELYN